MKKIKCKHCGSEDLFFIASNGQPPPVSVYGCHKCGRVSEMKP